MAARNSYYTGPTTDHFDGLRFRNPPGEPQADRSLLDVVRWKWTAPATRWPRTVPVEQIVPNDRVQGLRVTMVGHATLLIQFAGLNVLTDPLWSDRASPVSFAGPQRVTKPGIAFQDLTPIDGVLLSHNHYDHLDIATLKALQARDAPWIVTPLGNDTIIRRHIPAAQMFAGDWGDGFDVAKGARVHIAPAIHWSSRNGRDRRMALWGGFMLRVEGRLVYFAGDTGYGTGTMFRRLREEYGRPDLAILPIGAYDPRWFMADQHINPEEAVEILVDLDAVAAVGMHWGTFKLTDEPFDEPVQRLHAALQKRRIDPSRFTALRPAEIADFPRSGYAEAPVSIPDDIPVGLSAQATCCPGPQCGDRRPGGADGAD